MEKLQNTNNLKENKFITHKEFPLAFVKTYGCQQNVADSEKIKNALASLGYSIISEKEKADLIIFNTCAVRENAELRVFGNLGELKNLKKKDKNIIIAVYGCMTSQKYIAKKIEESFKFVDIILGANSISDLLYLIRDITIKRQVKEKDFIQSLNFNKFINSNLLKSNLLKKNNEQIKDFSQKRDNKIKALIPIMHVCNNFCSYCVVPYVRGREVSRKSEEILAEVKNLIKSGYKEITLLVQNVNSYGKTLNSEIIFTDLLREITKISGEFWVRFMTSHPKDISKELIDEIIFNDKICNHIHLPVQSGSNEILKKMNRKYTREKYLKIINYAKQKAPLLSFSSDIIVGFPCESSRDFEDTLSLVNEVKFSFLFNFIYSKRRGTPAFDMSDNLTKETKSNRLSRLIEIQRGISSDFSSNFLGKTVKVLLEESKIKDKNKIKTIF